MTRPKSSGTARADPPGAEILPAPVPWIERTNAARWLLGGLLIVAWLYYTVQSLQVRNYTIMTDELQYLKLAINSISSPLPTIRGEYFPSYNQLYPWLLAPFSAILPMPKLFLAIHILNPLVMSSVVIPVYLLARHLGVSRWGSLAAAAISVAGPWLAFSALVMTENVAYPVFAWTIYALTRAIGRPSTTNDLIAIAALALAFLARTQFILLAPVFAVAVILHEVNRGSIDAVNGRRLVAMRVAIGESIRGHRVFFGLCAITLAIGLVATAFGSALGMYDTVLEKSLLPNGTLDQMRRHLGTMITGFGYLPFLAGSAFTFAALRRAEVRPHVRGFAVLLLVVAIATMWQASAFNINFAEGRLNDRYAFYILPLFAIAMLLAVEVVRPRLRHFFFAGVLTWWLVRHGYYLGYDAGSWIGAPSSAIDSAFANRLRTLAPDLVVPSLLTAILAATLAAGRRTTAAVALIAIPVIAWNIASARYLFNTQPPFTDVSSASIKKSLETDGLGYSPSVTIPSDMTGPLDWIDRSIPGHSATLLPSETIPQLAWWQTEYWNRNAARMLRFVNPAQIPAYSETLFQDQLEAIHHDEFRVNSETGLVVGLTARQMLPHVVVAEDDARIVFAGAHKVTEHADVRLAIPMKMQLLKVDVPYRASALMENLLDDGQLLTGPSRLSVYGDGVARTVDVSLMINRMGNAEVPIPWRATALGINAGGTITKRLRLTRMRARICVPAIGRTVITIRATPSKTLGGRKSGLILTRPRLATVAIGCRR